MKLDLDELERAVQAAKDRTGVAVWQDPYSPTLALIARVRELERVADEALVYWASLAPLDAGRIGQLRELLEKGAVLP